MNILETEHVERFRSRIDPARVEYSMYPTKQKDGEGLQQRAGDALGELGRDHTSQSFGSISTGHGEAVRQSQRGWAPV